MNTTGLSFTEAMRAARDGKKIRRAAWSNRATMLGLTAMPRPVNWLLR